ncbi:MAG TPA: ATP-dependent metallopeptidase FtsH/Yme1/Tma family protein, partial [Rhodothermales bacterium]|nr:ATP-dependent metallopeptidase FtsH/Yme1/Tma family protein [Rhodothermales bacterium]
MIETRTYGGAFAAFFVFPSMAQDERNSRPERPPIETPRGDSRRPQERRPRLLQWLVLAAFAAVILHVLFFFGTQRTSTLEYSQFLRYLEAGDVEQVTIVNDLRVDGRYTQEAVAAGRVRVPAPSRDLFSNRTTEAPRTFSTTKPRDHDLTDFVLAYNERVDSLNRQPVEFAARVEQNLFGGLLSWVLPLVFLIALW